MSGEPSRDMRVEAAEIEAKLRAKEPFRLGMLSLWHCTRRHMSLHQLRLKLSAQSAPSWQDTSFE